MLLLIVGLLITFSSVSAQYIENDTRFDDGTVKATRTMSVTTTSVEEPTLLNAVNTTADAEPALLDAEITTTNVEPELYDEADENNINKTYLLIVGIIPIFLIL